MKKDKMMPPPARPLGKEQLSSKVKEFPVNYGASVVGITTVETLAGGPPSTGLTYVLEGARSAITFAVPLDENKTRDYLGKIDRAGHQKDYTRASIIADGIAAQLASFLRQFGHQSVAVMQNLVFRNDRPGGMQSVSPEEATGHIAAMQPIRRALFEISHPEDSDAKEYSGMGHHIHYSKETERRKGAGEEKETSDIGQE